MTSRFRDLETSRLRLRAWRPEDLPAFADLNADPRVTEYLLGPLTRAQSDSLAERFALHFEREGFGWWAVEAPGVSSFIGAVGISVPAYTAPFTPCVEVGWRLAHPFWSQGFATEAAQAAIAFGFRSVGLSEIVALTVPDNVRSRSVMAKLGMTRSPADDFEHPMVPVGHRLAQHVLYRLSRRAWLAEHTPPSADAR